MQKRETTNHNDKYVVFFEFEDEADRFAALDSEEATDLTAPTEPTDD